MARATLSKRHRLPTLSPMRALPVALLALLLAACQAGGPWRHELGADDPRTGRVLDVAQQRYVEREALLADLADADFVLIGERHDNLDHHRLEAELTAALQAAAPEPRVVAFEMIPSDRQLALVEHLQAHPGDAAGLGAAVDWQDLGWPDWRLYQPIAAAALAPGATIVAADLSALEKEAVFHLGPGVLRASLVRRTGLDRRLPDALAAGLAQELRDSHCGTLPEPVVEGMFRVQRARDAMMADRLATVAGRRGGVLIAGNGHVRKDRGVPWYLARLRPEARILSVGLVEVGGPVDADDLPYDYAWFTPRVDDAPACGEGAAASFRPPRPL
jgi:uncharacterized iron-regulated protein